MAEGTSATGWPYTGLPDLRNHVPTPIREFVLKIQSRCNLNCSYCYVYNLGDTSWRQQPKGMDERVVQAAMVRIAEHADTHGVDRLAISLHGGEPLLGGVRHVVSTVDQIRAMLGPQPADLIIQTNGVLLDQTMAEALAERGVRIGISLDGDRSGNDLNRLFNNGRSSYEAVLTAVALMSQPHLAPWFSGLLCTIQLDRPPADIWRHFVELGVPSVDFLLPHATWQTRPPIRGELGSRPTNRSPTPYADWLRPIFDTWFDAPERPMGVRMFEDLMNLILGGTSSYEGFGLAPVTLAIIETDGSYEQVDSLKAAYDGAAATGLNVFQHSIDELLQQPGIAARQIGAGALSAVCQSCDIMTVCGGGMYAHRYQEDTGFKNPSVYCPDLYALIDHIRSRLDQALTMRGTSIDAVRAG